MGEADGCGLQIWLLRDLIVEYDDMWSIRSQREITFF